MLGTQKHTCDRDICTHLREVYLMSQIKKVALGAFMLGAVSALQTRPTGGLSEQSVATSGCNTDTDCEMSNAVCNNDYSNCSYCDEGACKPGIRVLQSSGNVVSSNSYSQAAQQMPTAKLAWFVMANISASKLVVPPMWSKSL